MATPKPEGLVNIKVFAGGSELPGEFKVRSIDIHREANRISSAEIIFLDGNPNTQEFALSDKSNLEPGNEVEVKVGYGTESESVFKGIIVKHGVKIVHGSSFTQIMCKDKAVLMTIENKCAIYEKKKDSDIIKSLISKYSGVSNDVEATDYEHPQLMQYDSTDWDFLVTRAELNSKIVNTIDNKVIVKKPKTESPVATLEYGTSIIEFEADIDAQSQLSKVTAYGWDIKKQENAEKAISSADFEDTGSLKSSSLASKVKKDGQKLFHPGHIASNELKDWATSKLLRSKMAKFSGRVKSKGIPGVVPGKTVELKGIGKKFNGKAYITGVRQEINSGYWFTHIQFGLSPEMQTQNYNISSYQASGLLPAVHGLQIGIVKKIYEDPDNEHRIQVSLPAFGSNTNVWARKIFPDAGDKRGLYFVPEVKDEVIVGFLNNDARFPVILGSLHSSKNKPPYTTDAKNKEKGFFSREKLQLTFDDVDKIITIETPSKHSIVLSDKDKSIVITDKSKNKITMKPDLIEMSGVGDITIKAKKNIKIEGMKIDISAKTDANVSAVNIKNTAKAQFKASGNAGAEVSSGAQTKITAGAMVQVQGAIVKIN